MNAEPQMAARTRKRARFRYRDTTAIEATRHSTFRFPALVADRPQHVLSGDDADEFAVDDGETIDDDRGGERRFGRRTERVAPSAASASDPASPYV